MTDLFGDTLTRPIKALSIWQPYASLMAAGVRRHEPRGWTVDYRGPIAIHAAKTLDMAGAPEALCRAVWGLAWPNLLPLGAVVAIGRLSDCRPARQVYPTLTGADRTSGNYGPGRHALEITGVRALQEPIPLAGRQHLFNWTPPEDLADRLGPLLDHRAACRAIGWP